MSIEKINLREEFVSEIRDIIISARNSAIRSVDRERVQMYWRLGERIFNEEQEGKERAEYGSYLLRELAQKTEMEFGSGFSIRQLAYARLFYKTYPILHALRAKFNCMQYKLLIQINFVKNKFRLHCGRNSIGFNC